jgi:hypothetical protein
MMKAPGERVKCGSGRRSGCCDAEWCFTGSSSFYKKDGEGNGHWMKDTKTGLKDSNADSNRESDGCT